MGKKIVIRRELTQSRALEERGPQHFVDESTAFGARIRRAMRGLTDPREVPASRKSTKKSTNPDSHLHALFPDNRMHGTPQGARSAGRQPALMTITDGVAEQDLCQRLYRIGVSYHLVVEDESAIPPLWVTDADAVIGQSSAPVSRHSRRMADSFFDWAMPYEMLEGWKRGGQYSPLDHRYWSLVALLDQPASAFIAAAEEKLHNRYYISGIRSVNDRVMFSRQAFLGDDLGSGYSNGLEFLLRAFFTSVERAAVGR